MGLLEALYPPVHVPVEGSARAYGLAMVPPKMALSSTGRASPASVLAVRALLVERGPMTANEVAAVLGLSTSTVSVALRRLIVRGDVMRERRFDPVSSAAHGGRRVAYFYWVVGA